MTTTDFGRTTSGNRLLDRLPAAEKRRLAERATEAELVVGSVLCEAGKRMSHVYFPHGGAIALFADGEPGESVHVALVGEEGMLGLPVAVGASIASLHGIVHGEGSAAQLDALAFFKLLKICPVLRHSLLVYSHRLVAQIAQTAVCNTLHPVPSRLARWLLTASDRLHSLSISATQAHIAATLGVPRLPVQQAASELQEAGLICYKRGVIEVLDRSSLKQRACACYGVHARIYKEALE